MVFCTASERPPTMSLTPANKSLKMFIPKAHSAVTISMRLVMFRLGAVSVVRVIELIAAAFCVSAATWVVITSKSSFDLPWLS